MSFHLCNFLFIIVFHFIFFRNPNFVQLCNFLKKKMISHQNTSNNMLSMRSLVKVCPCNPSLNLWTNSKDSFGTQKNFSCPFSPQHDRLFFLLKEEELRSLFTLLFISFRYLKSFPSLLNSLNYYLLFINIICFFGIKYLLC